MESSQIIVTKELTKSFPIGGGSFTALKNINVSINEGEFLGLVGPSGSGKTTLLNIVGALDIPSSGSVEVLGKYIENMKHRESASLRNKSLGFIFQTFNLLPFYSVFENVELPLLLLKTPDKERKEKIMNALEWVGLTSKVNSRPAQLSGGECQRVAVARAMVKVPKIVLADEPTANLDAQNSHNILEMMLKLNEQLKTTFIFATHDNKVIQYLNRKIILNDGIILEDK
ncbi:MAG: ABC transporter ATP-binding protein [Pseudomonadota bacterium]